MICPTNLLARNTLTWHLLSGLKDMVLFQENWRQLRVMWDLFERIFTFLCHASSKSISDSGCFPVHVIQPQMPGRLPRITVVSSCQATTACEVVDYIMYWTFKKKGLCAWLKSKFMTKKRKFCAHPLSVSFPYINNIGFNSCCTNSTAVYILFCNCSSFGVMRCIQLK